MASHHNQCISVVLCSAYKSVCGGTYVHDLLMLCYSQWCFFLLIVYALVSHIVVQYILYIRMCLTVPCACLHTYLAVYTSVQYSICMYTYVYVYYSNSVQILHTYSMYVCMYICLCRCILMH